jgi:methoxymalonate biosynthesis acyl carrier protein
LTDNATTIASPIREFIVGRFPQVRFGDDDDIFSLGFVNSLFAMELVMFIEKTFEFRIPNAALQIRNFRSVHAMSELVEAHRAVARQG